MALATLWANKMRSLLTIVGIVIGITAIVGMTAIMRGFNDSIAEMFKELGPDTIIVARMVGGGGNDIDRKEMARRPNLTVEDMKAIQRRPGRCGRWIAGCSTANGCSTGAREPARRRSWGPPTSSPTSTASKSR
jgi:putative ABC transport system permease protein